MSITDVASWVTFAWCLYLLAIISTRSTARKWGLFLYTSAAASISITAILSIVNVNIKYAEPASFIVAAFQILCMTLVIIEGLIVMRYK